MSLKLLNVWITIIPLGSGWAHQQQCRLQIPGALKRDTMRLQQDRSLIEKMAAAVCTCVMGQMSMAGGSRLLVAPVLKRTALSALPERRLRAGSNSPASLGLLPASSAVHLQ